MCVSSRAALSSQIKSVFILLFHRLQSSKTTKYVKGNDACLMRKLVPENLISRLAAVRNYQEVPGVFARWYSGVAGIRWWHFDKNWFCPLSPRRFTGVLFSLCCQEWRSSTRGHNRLYSTHVSLCATSHPFLSFFVPSWRPFSLPSCPFRSLPPSLYLLLSPFPTLIDTTETYPFLPCSHRDLLHKMTNSRSFHSSYSRLSKPRNLILASFRYVR